MHFKKTLRNINIQTLLSKEYNFNYKCLFECYFKNCSVYRITDRNYLIAYKDVKLLEINGFGNMFIMDIELYEYLNSENVSIFKSVIFKIFKKLLDDNYEDRENLIRITLEGTLGNDNIYDINMKKENLIYGI